jgi:hypothetical protein
MTMVDHNLLIDIVQSLFAKVYSSLQTALLAEIADFA